MATPRLLARIEALAWIGIYGGLFALVLGLFPSAASAAAALRLGGGLALAAGVLLILLRSRLQTPGAGDPRPPAPKNRRKGPPAP